MKTRLDQDAVNELCDALLAIKSREECRAFLEDAFTKSEIQAIAQRLEVARLLHEDETYTDISQRTGASTATISRVNRCLQYGAGGYETILERLNRK